MSLASFEVLGAFPLSVPSESQAAQGWLRQTPGPGEEELMEKHRAKCSVLGGLELKTGAFLSEAAHSVG